MSEQTKIAWCDSTINFWSGCTKVSDGCKNCYAETLSNRFTTGKPFGKGGGPNIGQWGNGAPRKLHESAFKLAVNLNKKPWVCNECGFAWNVGDVGTCLKCKGLNSFHRRRIFSLSLGDINDPEVPIEWAARTWDRIHQCPDVTWIVCSKRWELFKSRLACAAAEFVSIGRRATDTLWMASWAAGDFIPDNIILLTSVENQAMADKRIPELLKIPAACRGLSLEPLLGPVDLKLAEVTANPATLRTEGNPLDWLIIGGESGLKARPCNVEWIRSLVQQGKAAGVATFVKQLGANFTEPYKLVQTGKLNHPKGGDPAEWPEDLRVREFPGA